MRKTETMATVSDFMLDRLELWGIETIFGYPGDGINGIKGALDRAGDRFRFVQVRTEQMRLSPIPTSRPSRRTSPTAR